MRTYAIELLKSTVAEIDFKNGLVFKYDADYIYFELRSNTVCPRSSDAFYISTYYIKQVTTSWIYSTFSFMDF